MFKPGKFRLCLIILTACLFVSGGFAVGYVIRQREVSPNHLYRVKRNVLYRSAQPRDLQWSYLDRHNIETVINLRPQDESPSDFAEELRQCSAAGIRFVNIPISGSGVTEDQVLQFIRAVRESNGTLVHCAQGRSRTGIMVATYRVVVQNWPAERAIRDMERHGWHKTNGKSPEKATEILYRLQNQRDEWKARTAPDNS